MTILAPNTVLVSEQNIRDFRAQWPCSGLPSEGFCVSFEFARNGDLVDINWFTDEGIDAAEPDGADGPALLALSQDAQAFLNAN